MPGPGPHMMYALSTGLALTTLSNGKFSPHHSLTYSINAFFGPDIGSFIEWLTLTLGFAQSLGSAVHDVVHNPFNFVLLLGFPLSLLYSYLSRLALHKGLLNSASGVPLNRKQCFLLVAAGSFSHFFLDYLFESIGILNSIYANIRDIFNMLFFSPNSTVARIPSHNPLHQPFRMDFNWSNQKASGPPQDVCFCLRDGGHSTMYTWIISTGWWEGRAPVNPDGVFVVGFLCACLIGGFIYINSMVLEPLLNLEIYVFQSEVPIVLQPTSASIFETNFHHCKPILLMIYWVNPRRAPVGEEPDLGILVFLAVCFFLPHYLCILSMG
ncbi:hypothetical protein RJ641_009203 [Dillenia turbinata]|uniref:Uncharacterized protein n=1 Tax=Dillenia turbinata TaxID=194707 RepID=A0AAN8V8T9_9MAGN